MGRLHAAFVADMGSLFCCHPLRHCLLDSLNSTIFTRWLTRLSSYLVWVGVKFSNAKEEELLINDASQIGSKKFDFSIE